MQVNPSGADDNEFVAPNVGNMACHAIVMKSHLQHYGYINACKNNASERFVMQHRSHGRATIHRLNHVCEGSRVIIYDIVVAVFFLYVFIPRKPFRVGDNTLSSFVAQRVGHLRDLT